jgi:hypothetical protein
VRLLTPGKQQRKRIPTGGPLEALRQLTAVVPVATSPSPKVYADTSITPDNGRLARVHTEFLDVGAFELDIYLMPGEDVRSHSEEASSP